MFLLNWEGFHFLPKLSVLPFSQGCPGLETTSPNQPEHQENGELTATALAVLYSHLGEKGSNSYSSNLPGAGALGCSSEPGRRPEPLAECHPQEGQTEAWECLRRPFSAQPLFPWESETRWSLSKDIPEGPVARAPPCSGCLWMDPWVCFGVQRHLVPSWPGVHPRLWEDVTGC